MISDHCLDASSVLGFRSDRRIGKKSVTLVFVVELETDLLLELLDMLFRFDLNGAFLLSETTSSLDDALVPPFLTLKKIGYNERLNTNMENKLWY